MISSPLEQSIFLPTPGQKSIKREGIITVVVIKVVVEKLEAVVVSLGVLEVEVLNVVICESVTLIVLGSSVGLFVFESESVESISIDVCFEERFISVCGLV